MNTRNGKRIKYKIQSYNTKYTTERPRWKNNLHITTVKQLDVKNLRIPRAGFFLYTVVNGRIFIGLGIDSKNHELTDFAGQVMYGIGETVLHGALRELKEETLEIFSPLSSKDIENCLTIYDENNLVIFMNVGIHPEIISQDFNEKYQASMAFHREVCGITWLSVDEFKDAINNTTGVIYERVQNFLKSAGDFTCHL